MQSCKLSNILTRDPGTRSASRMCTKWPPIISMNACETACGTGMKEFWNNQNRSEEAHDLGRCTLNLVLKILSPSSLAGKALVLVPVSASYAGADPKERLAGGGPGQMQQATSLPKQRHRNHTSEECSVCIVATVWAAGQNQT